MTEKKMTPDQAKRRAQYARLVASLAAPQRTTLAEFLTEFEERMQLLANAYGLEYKEHVT
jgi:hypothetical protein